MIALAKIQRPTVIALGTFLTEERQTMNFDYLSSLPPGWSRTQNQITPPAGVYLYSPYFEAPPFNLWSKGGVDVESLGDDFIISCDGSQPVYLRMFPSAVPSKAGFTLTPL